MNKPDSGNQLWNLQDQMEEMRQMMQMMMKMMEDMKPKPESGEMETQTMREQNSLTEKSSKIYVADSTHASIYPSMIAPQKYYMPERYDGQSPSGLSQFLF